MKVFVTLAALFVAIGASARVTDYVDPRIGSEGLGRVYIGPCHPFGMARPSPDCTPSPNSGWLPMPERVDGFSQVHVSGTGGGPKYGNILIMPFNSPQGMDSVEHFDSRDNEEIALGYYATTLSRSGIKVEITAAPRTSVYRITYPPDNDLHALAIDAGFFLGETPEPDAREAQQLVGSQIEVVGDRAVKGYSRIRGGWNNGRAYTVYFYAEASAPFEKTATWRDSIVDPGETRRVDLGDKTGTIVTFPCDTREVTLKVGISFISELKAELNCLHDTSGFNFDEVRSNLIDEWDKILGRVELAPEATDTQRRMFYTALYHTMLMPTDRTGECPLWNDPIPYYDDYYAIWDTYRSSVPLITLLDPDRQRDMVNSLLIIAKRDGFMPDARSGNANGRTQGGSNAEIVIADAMARGIDGIDYEAALQAMLRDAEVSPGFDHEAHGRGGLEEYNSLGYIPHGIPRAGNRTVEYSFDDWAIASVAERLGHRQIADKYYRKSDNWRNLWRADYEHDGSRGFIMPRDRNGEWLDSIPFGHSSHDRPKFRYTPITFEGPWYAPWWNMFFYEASSWEYSLSIPHDVPGLVEMCGGPQAMLRRLDTFFDRPYYNVNNEPSFLTPCLYHWIGRPDLSSDRVREIITENFGDSPLGLPGNDDSGAMSSFLAFHMLGLYPNAGHDYYLIHSPLVAGATIYPPAGKPFKISTRNFSPRNRYIVSARLNGAPYDLSTITHATILNGGELELTMGSKPGNWGKNMFSK